MQRTLLQINNMHETLKMEKQFHIHKNWWKVMTQAPSLDHKVSQLHAVFAKGNLSTLHDNLEYHRIDMTTI